MRYRRALVVIALAACGGGHAHHDAASSACSPRDAGPCTVDQAACCTDADCCSGICTNGTCGTLNTTCHTTGNRCSNGTSSECCSHYCPFYPDGTFDDRCAAASYCAQAGDLCTADAMCCEGRCNLVPGYAVGTCARPMVSGPTCAAGATGDTCVTCTDCCSRVCHPPPIGNAREPGTCEPTGGCRVDGDTCVSDADCCGAAGTGLPGAGNVRCNRELATDTYGFCGGGSACVPEGGICAGAGSGCGSATVAADCCAGSCTPDVNGVPRCHSLGSACRNPGETCADATDCCNGTPCRRQPSGGFACGSACVPTFGTCTTSADCCSKNCLFEGGPTGTCR